MANKYGAKRTFSQLCQREFDSKVEMLRGEELHLRQLAGEIHDLEYQPQFVLNEKPRCVYTADFRYRDGIALAKDSVFKAPWVVEDVKGVMTEAARLRIIWLKQRTQIEVRIIRR